MELYGSIDGGNLVLQGTSWRIGLLIFVPAFLIVFELCLLEMSLECLRLRQLRLDCM